MSLKKVKATANQGGNFEYPEPGNHLAVLVAIVDLGTHEEEYKGKSYDARKLFFVWELVQQQMTGSTFNHVVGLSYNYSFGEKANLRKMVGAWRGKPIADGEEFDLSVLLGKSCLLNVQPVEGKDYVKLDPVCATPLPKGMPTVTPKRKPVFWEIDGSEELPEHLDWLPYLYGEKVTDKIQRSKEWQEKSKSGVGSSVGADEGEVGGNEYPDF